VKVKLRLSAVAIALLVPALVLARWTTIAGFSGELVSPLSLPREIGPWRATVDEQLDAETLAMIEPDTYVLRRYEAPGRTAIWVYVAIYGGRAGYAKGAHDPKVCYPAAGWEILDTRSLDIPVGGSESLRAELVSVHKGTLRKAAVYWFQPAERWPVNPALEQLLQVFDAIAGWPQYAFVRLSGPSHENPTAVRDLAEFAGEIAPAIRTALERLDLADQSAHGVERADM